MMISEQILPKLLFPEPHVCAPKAIQTQDEALLVEMIEQGGSLSYFTEEGFKRLYAATIRLRGLHGLEFLEKKGSLSRQALRLAFVETMDLDLFGVAAFCMRQGVVLPEGILKKAVANDLQYVAAELFLAGLDGTSLDMQEWEKLIDFVVIGDYQVADTSLLNQKACNRLLHAYSLEANFAKIKKLLTFGVDPQAAFVECVKDPERLKCTLFFLHCKPDLRCPEEEEWLEFLVDAISSLSIEEIKSFGVSFDQKHLTKLFFERPELALLTKVNLIYHGAQVDERAIQLLLRDIFDKKDEESACEFRFLLDKCPFDTVLVYLDLVLTKHLVDYKWFKQEKFPQKALQIKLIEHTKNKNLAAVKKLLLLGVDVNEKDTLQKTALHHALEAKQYQLALLLLEAGADAGCKDAEGKTPLSLAETLGSAYVEIITQHKQTQERFQLIESEPNLRSCLTSTEIRQLARYFVLRLPQVKRKKYALCKRSEHLGSYSFLYRQTQEGHDRVRAVYVLCKGSGRLNEKGTFNKVTEAIQILLNSELKPASVKLMARRISQKGLTKGDIETCRMDHFLQSQVNHQEGIWPTFDAFEENDRDGTLRLQSFSERGWTFHRLGRTLSNKQKLIAMASYIKGLMQIHSRGIIHGDIKSTNCLLIPSLPDNVIAGWIDFGLGFRLVLDGLNYVMRSGFYGMLEATPPELFGNRNFSGDLHKVEVYAFGYMLYTVFFNHVFPWRDFVINSYDTRHEQPITSKHIQELRRQVYESVEIPYQALCQETLSFDDALRQLILKMMRLEPRDRPNLLQALHDVELLLTYVP